MTAYRILLTGSAGFIGKTIAKDLLARGHFVRGLDLKPNPDLPENHIGSITDAALVDTAMDSIDTLIHLAATPDDADFLTNLLPNNIVGLFNVMNAARRQKVRRAVLASSGQVIGGLYKKGGPIKISDGVAPRNHYALTKAFAEDLGLMYSLEYKMSVVVARIGWCHRNVDSVRYMCSYPWTISSYLSHRDTARFFVRAVEADPVSYAIAFAVSSFPGQRHDLTPGRELIGYDPQDTFPEGFDFPLPPDVIELCQKARAKVELEIQKTTPRILG